MEDISVMEGLIIDNFAGGGGASTGIELALGRYPLPNVEKELLNQLRDLYNSPANLKGLPESGPGPAPEYGQRRLRGCRAQKPEEAKK